MAPSGIADPTRRVPSRAFVGLADRCPGDEPRMNKKSGEARKDDFWDEAFAGPIVEPIWLHALTTLLMTASAIVQGLLIGQFLRYAAIPHSEQRGWLGMGLMVMTIGALFVIVPGTVAAIYRFALALRRYRHGEDAKLSIALNGLVMLMPVAVILVLRSADAPREPAADRSPPTPPAPAADLPKDESAAGFHWANTKWIDDPEACSSGSMSFREGCRHYALECRTLPCEYRAQSGETVTIFARPSRRAETAGQP
jgi:hypothetical protein